jgi:hypothetical protein
VGRLERAKRRERGKKNKARLHCELYFSSLPFPSLPFSSLLSLSFLSISAAQALSLLSLFVLTNHTIDFIEL